MDDRSFEELIGDLSGQGMRVYVSAGRGRTTIITPVVVWRIL